MFSPQQDTPRNPPFGGLFTRRRNPADRMSSSQQAIHQQSPLMTNQFMQHSGHKQAGTGLISKLFQKKRPSVPHFTPEQTMMTQSYRGHFPHHSSDPSAATLGAAVSGGGLATVLNFLENAQRSLEAVQIFAPMVQQYGPLVKSLPEIIAMFSENKEDEEAENNSEEASAEEKEGSDDTIIKSEELKPVLDNKNIINKKNTHIFKRKKETTGRTPPPKLYI